MVGVGVVTRGCGGRKVDGEAGHEAWTRNIFREISIYFSRSVNILCSHLTEYSEV